MHIYICTCIFLFISIYWSLHFKLPHEISFSSKVYERYSESTFCTISHDSHVFQHSWFPLIHLRSQGISIIYIDLKNFKNQHSEWKPMKIRNSFQILLFLIVCLIAILSSYWFSLLRSLFWGNTHYLFIMSLPGTGIPSFYILFSHL